VLLVGPPELVKLLLAKAIAGEAGAFLVFWCGICRNVRRRWCFTPVRIYLKAKENFV